MPLFKKEQLYNVMGVRKTRQLFREFTPNQDEAIFTIKRYDDYGCYSLCRLYLEFAVDDPTEVSFSEYLFGDHDFWMHLRGTYVLKDLIPKWEAEAEELRISKQIKNVLESTLNEKSRLQAAKFLLEHGHKFRPGKTDGRKAKAENRERVADVINSEAFAADIERLSEFGKLN
jgi:hypothetical protein